MQVPKLYEVERWKASALFSSFEAFKVNPVRGHLVASDAHRGNPVEPVF